MSNNREILEEKARELRRRMSYTTDSPTEHEREGPPTPHPPKEKRAFSSFCAAVTDVLAESIDVSADALKEAVDKTALGKMLGELVKMQKDPARLANIARLATSRGAQLAAAGAPKAKAYLTIGNVAAQRMAKAAADLTESARADLPKKDFAVPAKKSNTGKRAYPIPDEQHARSALGFAKMHGDSADYARVRAKVEQKYPNLIKKQAKVPTKGPKLHAAEQVFFSKEAEGLLGRLGKSLSGGRGAHVAELAGLGILAGPSADEAVAHLRGKDPLLSRKAKTYAELAGLGTLAAPSIAHLVGKH